MRIVQVRTAPRSSLLAHRHKPACQQALNNSQSYQRDLNLFSNHLSVRNPASEHAPSDLDEPNEQQCTTSFHAAKPPLPVKPGLDKDSVLRRALGYPYAR